PYPRTTAARRKIECRLPDLRIHPSEQVKSVRLEDSHPFAVRIRALVPCDSHGLAIGIVCGLRGQHGNPPGHRAFAISVSPRADSDPLPAPEAPPHDDA